MNRGVPTEGFHSIQNAILHLSRLSLFLTLALLFSEHFLASTFVENPSTVLDAEKIVIEAG